MDTPSQGAEQPTERQIITRGVQAKLVMNGPLIFNAELFLDGVKQRYVRRLRFSTGVDEVPTLTVEYIAALEFEGVLDNVNVQICPMCQEKIDIAWKDKQLLEVPTTALNEPDAFERFVCGCPTDFKETTDAR